MQTKNKQSDPSGNSQGYQFGTFKGVFMPSILTILGVIMFLRLGWVLGHIGLAGTLLIVTLATSVTFLTGLSLSMLSTNSRVGRGGAYYIISRSLGLEVGGAIGLPLYGAQALGIAFYIAGFSEAVTTVFPALDPRLVGVATLVVLAILAYVSADLALRVQFLVLACIFAALISFFAGTPLTPSELPAEPVRSTVTFWAAFAIFFPAVTGIEAGLAMSGDLKNPSKSLPLGTICAVVVGYLVYMAIPLFFSWLVPDTDVLRNDTMAMRLVARWKPLIVLGVWAATLSSAMGALLGAPRTLQALAKDRVLPRFIGRGFGSGGDPRIATVITFGIALAGILGGGLNVIAPILSMFFLASYALINASAGLEEWVHPPSWRPTFRVHYVVSLAGGLFCLAVMLMINAGATIVAVAILAAAYYIMKRRRLRTSWGDARYGIMMLILRSLLLKLDKMKVEERTWNPNILVCSGAPTKRWYLIQLAHALAQHNSFVTVASVLPREDTSQERIDKVKTSIRSFLDKYETDALVEVLAHSDPIDGIKQLVTSYGFGPLQPNLILLGETEDPLRFRAYSGLIENIYRNNRNLAIVREFSSEENGLVLGGGNRIDIWWRGEDENIGLMLTLAYLLRRSDGWQASTLTVNTIVPVDDDHKATEDRISKYLADQRVDAEAHVVIQDEADVYRTIRVHSRDAGLVVCGLRAPGEQEKTETYQQYYRQLLSATSGFPPTAFVLAAEEISFARLFDTGAIDVNRG